MKMLRSFKQLVIKKCLKKKYASQLKRSNDFSIHTAEGWNDIGRISHTKILIDRCIEPTEENLQKYQEEVNAKVRELEIEYPSKPLPVEPKLALLSIPDPRLTVEQKQEVDEFEKIFNFTPISSFISKSKQVNALYERAARQFRSHIFGLGNVYYMGYIQGIRAERKRRNKNAQAI